MPAPFQRFQGKKPENPASCKPTIHLRRPVGLHYHRFAMARWALISAEHGADAAALALEVSARLTARGVRVGGFVQRKCVAAAGQKIFDVVHLQNQETVALSRHAEGAKAPVEERSCAGSFQDAGFAAARRWVEEDAPAVDVLVVDGGRKLEVAGRGHCLAVERALGLSGKVVLLCAKASQLFHLVERFGLEESDLVAALELPADAPSVEQFIRDVFESARMVAKQG